MYRALSSGTLTIRGPKLTGLTPNVLNESEIVLEDTLSIPADEPEEDDNLLELEPDEIKDEAQLKKWLSLLDIQEINERLEDAIADENYEYAKMYKDELRRREEEEDTNK